jgi:hypothetical protein
VDSWENDAMKSTIRSADAAELDSDTIAVIEHAMTGKPLDPAIAKRVREQGEKLRQEIFEKNGLLDIAVPAVREFRGEIP